MVNCIMEIALIADDTKKELMTQFCIAYCGILSKHKLCSTSITGRYIAEATGYGPYGRKNVIPLQYE